MQDSASPLHLARSADDIALDDGTLFVRTALSDGARC